MRFTTLTTLFLATATFGMAEKTSRVHACTNPSKPDRTVPAHQPIQTQYGQCGGKDYNGPKKCSNGWSCKKQNEYYSQCLEGKSNEREFYGQCGGKDYSGPTKCAYPGTCQKKDEYYSQCL